jgi:hypothetical protein
LNTDAGDATAIARSAPPHANIHWALRSNTNNPLRIASSLGCKSEPALLAKLADMPYFYRNFAKRIAYSASFDKRPNPLLDCEPAHRLKCLEK